MLDTSVIGNNHGFEYKANFRPMLLKAIGLLAVQNLELALEKKMVLDILINELQSVKRSRDDAAHTWIEGTTKSYPAPSVTKGRLNTIFPLLREVRSVLKP